MTMTGSARGDDDRIAGLGTTYCDQVFSGTSISLQVADRRPSFTVVESPGPPEPLFRSARAAVGVLRRAMKPLDVGPAEAKEPEMLLEMAADRICRRSAEHGHQREDGYTDDQSF